MAIDPHLLVCIGNSGAEDLELLKVYRRLPDVDAEERGFVRVVDDSGDSYLYPQSTFLPLPLPENLERELEGLVVERSKQLA